MRLLICAGGTGGGVYPALSVLQAVGNRAESVLWVGGKNGMEADLVSHYQIPYTEIPAAGVHGVGLRALPGNLVKLLRGTFISRKILRGFRPDVLLFTGGYLAVPMALAGNKINSLLYVPDIEPGMALKALSRFADVIALTVEKSRKYFKPQKRMVVTGYPTRSDLQKMDKLEARKVFGLTGDLPVLLVIGGSKGAHSINAAIMENLPSILQIAQVIHVTGQLDWNEIKQTSETLDSEVSGRYHPYPYLHEEIGAAFSCADLAISRAGASTLGEFPLFGLPAILVPYPYAWRYQKVNADHLVENGAAVIVENSELTKKLLPTLISLLEDDRRISSMRANMSALATANAASKIAALLVDLAHKEKSGRVM